MTTSLSTLFVGSYADADQPGLYAFDFDQATGALTARGAFSGVLNPSFIRAHPNGRWLYTVGETGQASHGQPGSVWAWRRDPASGALTPVNHQPSGGDWPCHLQLDAAGRWLFVANYGTGNASVLPIQADGSLGAPTEHVQHVGLGANPQRQEGPHAHSTTLTPDEHFAIVADLGIDQLVVYRLDAARGTLQPHSRLAARPGAGPRHLAFHPNGRVVYVANELDSTVSVCAYTAADGALREVQALSTLPPNPPENGVADLHLDAAAQHLYVSNRGHNSLAVYAVDAEGALTTQAIVSCGGNWPRNFALAPGGRFVLVANQYSGEVTVLALNAAGEPGAAVARAAVPQAACLQFA